MFPVSGFDLERTVLKPHHIKACSGRGFVGTVPGTIASVRGLGFAPYTAHDFRLLSTFVEPVTGKVLRDWEGTLVSDSLSRLEVVGGFPDAADPRSLYKGGELEGWSIRKRGAVHWREKDQMISFRLNSRLTPLVDQHGFCLTYEFSEIDLPGDTLVIDLEVNEFLFGLVKPWVWVDPISKHRATRISPLEFAGDGCVLCLGVSAGQTGNTRWTIRLDGARTRTVHLVGIIAPDITSAREQLAQVLGDPATAVQRAQAAWTAVEDAITARLPEFECDLEPLKNFYDVSLRTLMTNRWDTPEHMLRPFFATSGLGYSNGAYFWDMSYCPKVMAMWEPEATKRHIQQWLTVDPHACNQFSPFDGAPLGGWYSLNDFAIVKLVFEYCLVTGDKTLLADKIGETSLLGRLKELLEDSETRFEFRDGLLNYGRNENLLELRSSGYEGFVASPNGERYYCWQRLADLQEWLGMSGQEARAKADSVRKVLFQKLWNDEAGWFDAITPEGRRETPYSVQVFNLLSSDIFEAEQLDRLLGHLNDEEFLSSHGLESFSKSDIRYELNDLDWGGGGTFTACGPVLALDLYQCARPQKAWDVLRRMLWWPEVLPYYPQVIRARKAGYEETQRPVCICGGAAAEVVIFGIFGLRYALDGTASVCVQVPPGVREASLKGVALREGTFDLLVRDGRINLYREGKSREIPAGLRVNV